MELLSQKIPKHVYFVLSSTENDLAFLFLAENPVNWEKEKNALEQGVANAIVVNLEKMTATIKQSEFEMMQRGPVFIN